MYTVYLHFSYQFLLLVLPTLYHFFCQSVPTFLHPFVSTVLFKEPGDSSPTDGPVLNDEPARETRDASKVPRGVLDFSSGSEEDEEEEHGLKRKAPNPSVVDGIRGGNAATGTGRMSLLQHGFSRLLERVKGKPELGEGDISPGVEESTSEEDAEDQKRGGTSSGNCKSSNTGNGAVFLPKLGTKTCDISSSSDRENGDGGRQERVFLLKQSDDAVRKRQGLKGWTNKKITLDEESDENSSPDKKKPKTTVPKVHHFEGYSDESEDLDIEAMTGPKRATLRSHSRGGDRGRGRLDYNRKRQSASMRDKARSKHTEDIETFTSSEDEHVPVKKGRYTGCRFTSPQTERSRVELPKSGQRAATTIRTERQAGTSPASRGKDGTIDSVLGQIQYLFLYASHF